MKNIKVIIVSLLVIMAMQGCASVGTPSVGGRQELLKFRDLSVLTLGSLLSIKGDTYNVTESKGISFNKKEDKEKGIYR